MSDNIVEIIKNEDLSIDELGDIIKESLAKLYTKLETEIGMIQPIGIIHSVGRSLYGVDVRFISGEQQNPGESYESVYYL